MSHRSLLQPPPPLPKWEVDFLEWSNFAALIFMSVLLVLTVLYIKYKDHLIEFQQNITILYFYLFLLITFWIKSLTTLLSSTYISFVNIPCKTPAFGEPSSCGHCDIVAILTSYMNPVNNWCVVFIFWLILYFNNIQFNKIRLPYAYSNYLMYFLGLLTFVPSGIRFGFLTSAFLDDDKMKIQYITTPIGKQRCIIHSTEEPEYLTNYIDKRYELWGNLSLSVLLTGLLGFKLIQIFRLRSNINILDIILRNIFILFSVIIVGLVTRVGNIYWYAEEVRTLIAYKLSGITFALFMLFPIGNFFYNFFYYIPLSISDKIISRMTTQEESEDIELGEEDTKEDTEEKVENNEIEITEMYM